jgi:hypothetical protein
MTLPTCAKPLRVASQLVLGHPGAFILHGLGRRTRASLSQSRGPNRDLLSHRPTSGVALSDSLTSLDGHCDRAASSSPTAFS